MNSPHSHGLTQEARRNIPSSYNKEHSRDREPSWDLEDPSEGEKGQVVSDHKDSDLDQGNPNLDQLMLMAEEQ